MNSRVHGSVSRFVMITMTAALLSLLTTGCKDSRQAIDNDDPLVMPQMANQQCVVMIRPELVSSVKHPHLSKEYGMWGIFKRSTRNWVVIEKDNGEFWIPKDAILFIQFGGKIVMAPEWISEN